MKACWKGWRSRLQKFFQGVQRRHFTCNSQVTDVAMQMDVRKTLSCFYTTMKIPHESTRSIRIYFEIFFKWSCRLYEFATKMYFQAYVTTFAELAHKCRHRRKLHTNEFEMDLNYQQLRLRLSFACVGWTELSSEIFCPYCFLHFGCQKCFCFP